MSEPKPWWESAPLADGSAAAPAASDKKHWWLSVPEAPVAAPAGPKWSGSILPFSESADGKLQFDSNAGIVGSVKRAVTLPGDVYTGKADPMSDESIGRAFELGSMFGPTNPAIRAGDRAIPGVSGAKTVPGKTATPAVDDLYRAAEDGYARVRDSGVDYRAQSVADMAAGIRAKLDRQGLIAENAPVTHQILAKLASPPDGSVASISGLDAARQAFNRAAGKFTEPNDQRAAMAAIDGIDDFIKAADPRSVVAGPAARAGAEIVDARGNYAAAKRSDSLTGIEERADLRAAAANSGRNLDNTIRQRVADVVIDPQKSAGFVPEELAALEGVVRGTPVRNAARFVGNALGGGGGLGGTVTAGGVGAIVGSTFGPAAGVAAGLAVPATGYAAKSLGNRMTRQALNSVDELTRQRSPLFEAARAATPREVKNPAFEEALLRILMSRPPGTPAPQSQPPSQQTLIDLLRAGGA